MSNQKTILVVEDNLVDQRILSKYLETDTYDVVVTDNGQTAWDIILSEEYHFNLFILDWMVPGLNGLELIKKIKAHKKFRKIPIIMQTSRTFSNDITQVFCAGANYYMAKPLKKDPFLSVVHYFLKLEEKNTNAQEKDLRKMSKEYLAGKKIKESIFKIIQMEREMNFDLDLARIVTDFFIKSFSCTDYPQLAETLLETVKQIKFKSADGDHELNSLRCTIMIAGDEEVNLSDRGEKLKTDVMILKKCLHEKKTIIQGTYCVIPSRSSKAAILIRNMPVDPEEAKKAKQLAVLMLERFDERFRHFEDEMALIERNRDLEKKDQQIRRVLESCAKELEDINTNYQEIKNKQMDILEGNSNAILDTVKGLSREQKTEILQILDDRVNQAMQYYAEDQLTDQKFLMTIQEINKVLPGNKSNVNLIPQQIGESSQESVDDLLASLGL